MKASVGVDDRLEWIALQLIPGLGHVGCKGLISRFGSAESVFRARLEDLVSVEGVREDVARRVLKRQTTASPAQVLKKVERHGARIIRMTDPEYPASLRAIHDPPPLLYAKGKEIPATLPFVAVVGSRNPSHYGIDAARVIGQGLAKRGVGVVSGMARGIDAAAHWGALEGGGWTLAVFGTGIDIVYPESNTKLQETIVEKGAAVTELPPGSPPDAWNFPNRNRIISGIGKGVVVVEASMKSGSLITASLALEQGREVFAVPGSIDSFKSTGCHFLIKQGARLVENADDVLSELGLGEQPAPRRKQESFPFPPLEGAEKAIYDTLCEYPTHIDDIVKKGKWTAGEVSGILLKLELKGLVRQLPGKMFVR
jgi:DNA processing protein